VWAAATALVVKLDLDHLLTSLPLGPARTVVLVLGAHALLAVRSLLRVGAAGLAVALARLVLHGLLAVATVVALVLVGGIPVEMAVARTWGILLLLPQIVGVALALAPLEATPVPRQRPATRRSGAPHAPSSRARSAPIRRADASVPAVTAHPAAPTATESTPVLPTLIEPTRDLVTHVNGSSESAFEPDQGPRREAPATPPGEEPVASRAEALPSPPPESVEPMIHIPFARVADQLPPDAFRLPLERVAANLLEPGHLLVPQRLLLPQLAEGQAQVTWDVVAEQFPPQVLAWAHAEIARRLPGGALGLPLDEIVRQLPPDLLTVPGTTPDMRALEDFPLPFQPHVPPPSEEREPDPVEPAPVVLGDQESVPAAPEPPAADAVVQAEAPEPAELSGALSLAGARQLRVHPLGRWRIITLTGPDIAPEQVARQAADLADLLDDPRLPALASQLTVRSPRGTLVVTPIDAPSAGGPILAATAEPATALAQLERAALRMSRVGPLERRPPAPDMPADLLESPVSPAVREAAGRLRAFGPLTPAVLHDGGGLTLYLFLAPGTPARPIAGWARDLRAAVGGGWLGSLESAVVRLGEDRLLVREVEAGRGAAALLVVGGAPVSRPGLARLEMERAVARLGAH
jgi:hypothetical protein